MALGPVARMFPAEDWQREDNTRGGAVFAGRAGQVAVNVEREPAEGEAPAGQFNLDSHIRDAETGHPVPYLDVKVTVTRDGEAVYEDLPLVPVARPHKGVAGFHYGNNVALDPAGSYQVALSIAAGPLAGEGPFDAVLVSIDFGS
ncbi:MAG: iron transporter [Gemmatimonadales bacterium]